MKIKIYKLSSHAKQSLFALVFTLFLGTAYAQTTYTFMYTGAVQSMNVGAGDYIIKCWGADGGSTNGGKGGYSTGTITVSSPTTYYIYVGGVGTAGNTTGSGNVLGGWNGGGDGSCNSAYGTSGGGGGGSDVRTTQNTTYANRIIVAGGGGGGSVPGQYGHAGGNGGGTTGGNGVGYSNNTYWPGQGGTQIAGGPGTTESSSIVGAGSLGMGGSHSSTAPGSGWSGCGGGGGYYGGSAGGAVHSGGGGGSGYIGGLTSGTTIAFGQPGFVTNPDVNGNGYILITRLCDVNVTASKNPICEGESITLSTNAGSAIQWNTGATTTSITVSPSSTTSYTVSGASSAPSGCTSTVTIKVVVKPLPVLAAYSFPPVICAGGNGTLGASGAVYYTWSNGGVGASVIVNPTASDVYTVAGTGANGCVNTETVMMNVNTNMLTVTQNTTICKGSSVNLTANGVVNALWNTGSSFLTIKVAPTTNTVYSVSGTDVLGCTLSGTASVNVINLPVIGISADKQTICRGETIILTASGGSNYVWDNAETNASVTKTLSVNVPYQFSVTGTGSNGCTSSAMITVNPGACTGILVNEISSISIFPNPATQEITVSTTGEGHKSITVADVTGRIVLAVKTDELSYRINIENLPSGLYHVRVMDGNNIIDQKIVKQ